MLTKGSRFQIVLFVLANVFFSDMPHVCMAFLTVYTAFKIHVESVHMLRPYNTVSEGINAMSKNFPVAVSTFPS